MKQSFHPRGLETQPVKLPPRLSDRQLLCFSHRSNLLQTQFFPPTLCLIITERWGFSGQQYTDLEYSLVIALSKAGEILKVSLPLAKIIYWDYLNQLYLKFCLLACFSFLLSFPVKDDILHKDWKWILMLLKFWAMPLFNAYSLSLELNNKIFQRLLLWLGHFSSSGN